MRGDEKEISREKRKKEKTREKKQMQEMSRDVTRQAMPDDARGDVK
jgi:hypothetical protein